MRVAAEAEQPTDDTLADGHIGIEGIKSEVKPRPARCWFMTAVILEMVGCWVDSPGAP